MMPPTWDQSDHSDLNEELITCPIVWNEVVSGGGGGVRVSVCLTRLFNSSICGISV